MKLNIFNRTFAGIIFAAALSLGLSSCQDPIFYAIRQEVKLEEAKMAGEIYSIVRYNDDIFVSNGNIYCKNKNNEGHGNWNSFSKPEGHVLTLAADNNCLYAISITYAKDDSNGEMKVDSKKLYCYNGSWSEIRSFGTGENDVTHLMCTNDASSAKRHAYINISGKVYELSTNAISATPIANADDSHSCAVLGSNTEFFRGNAACANEDNTAVYYSSGSGVYKRTAAGADGTTVTSGVKGTVSSLAVMKDSILVNTNSGAALIARDSGSEIEFENLSSTLSSLYEGFACLAVDPSKTARESIIYASIGVKGSGSNSALFTHEALWSYYPSRGKWNIE